MKLVALGILCMLALEASAMEGSCNSGVDISCTRFTTEDNFALRTVFNNFDPGSLIYMTERGIGTFNLTTQQKTPHILEDKLSYCSFSAKNIWAVALAQKNNQTALRIWDLAQLHNSTQKAVSLKPYDPLAISDKGVVFYMKQEDSPKIYCLEEENSTVAYIPYKKDNTFNYSLKVSPQGNYAALAYSRGKMSYLEVIDLTNQTILQDFCFYNLKDYFFIDETKILIGSANYVQLSNFKNSDSTKFSVAPIVRLGYCSDVTTRLATVNLACELSLYDIGKCAEPYLEIPLNCSCKHVSALDWSAATQKILLELVDGCIIVSLKDDQKLAWSLPIFFDYDDVLDQSDRAFDTNKELS